MWVPVALYLFCFLGGLAENILGDFLNYDSLLMNVVVMLSLFVSCGGMYLIVLGALSACPIMLRLPMALFSYWLLTLGIVGSSLDIMLLLLYLFYWFMYSLLLTFWTQTKGWVVMSVSSSSAVKKTKFRFSILYLLQITTITALLLAVTRFFCLPSDGSSILGSNDISILQYFYGFFGSLILGVPMLAFTIVMLMDRKYVAQRLILIFLIDLLFLFVQLFLMYYRGLSPNYIYQVIAPSHLFFTQILPLLGIILMGLALRWAGYRIVRQTDSSQPSEPLLAS